MNSLLLKMFTSDQLTDSQIADIMDIWNSEYPGSVHYDKPEDFRTYIFKLKDAHHYLGLSPEGKVLGWLATFWRDDARWFVLLLSRKAQGKGLGTQLLREVQQKEAEITGWAIDEDRYTKADGSLYRSPIGFYKKNGFTIIPEVRTITDGLSVLKIQWKNQG